MACSGLRHAKHHRGFGDGFGDGFVGSTISRVPLHSARGGGLYRGAGLAGARLREEIRCPTLVVQAERYDRVAGTRVDDEIRAVASREHRPPLTQ